MGEPVRIQLSRKKGWRMPPNTVKVDRTTRWGNPYPVASTKRIHPAEAGYTAEQAVSAFKGRMHGLLAINAVDLSALRGKNLACWCKLGAPCHADVLLELANAPLLAREVEQVDAEALVAERLGERLRSVQSEEWACQEAVCTFPHDGNCSCFNTALAQIIAEVRAEL
jgi:hypothetical protein